MAREVERDDLDVTPDHVLVLKNAGPKGGPGMPEWGMLPIPKKLVQAGVRDMVRISDGRMSGTSYGACILHVVAGELRRRPARLRADRRRDRGRRRRAPHPSRMSRGGTRLAAAPRGRRRRRNIRAATARCSRSISARPTRAATSIFSRAPHRRASRKFIDRLRRAVLIRIVARVSNEQLLLDVRRLDDLRPLFLFGFHRGGELVRRAGDRHNALLGELCRASAVR